MTKTLIERTHNDLILGLLDHKWLIRSYLSDLDLDEEFNLSLDDNLHLNKNKNLLFFFKHALSPFKYLQTHQKQIGLDHGLKQITELCISPDLITNIDHEDNKLKYLSSLFNHLIGSTRDLLMCYDCGTVARGVFFSLIKAKRGDFKITKEEVQRIKDDYYMTKYPPSKAISILTENINKIKKDSLYLCAFDIDHKFGHIYIIEKKYIRPDNVRYRIYQSCRDSYLLIDYIELMDYANPDKGIDINSYLADLELLLANPDPKSNWEQTEISKFIKWFHYYPSQPVLATNKKFFASTYIIL